MALNNPVFIDILCTAWNSFTCNLFAELCTVSNNENQHCDLIVIWKLVKKQLWLPLEGGLAAVWHNSLSPLLWIHRFEVLCQVSFSIAMQFAYLSVTKLNVIISICSGCLLNLACVLLVSFLSLIMSWFGDASVNDNRNHRL